MTREHSYLAQLHWDGDPGVGTGSYGAYDRQYHVAIAGKPDLVGSAHRQFLGDPAVHDPEDLFLAAIAGCHMLSYLALCARAGITVVAYDDAASGVLVLEAAGGGQFAAIALHPRVQLAPGSDATAIARAIELHDRAHATCFIARSCSVPITCMPTVTTAAPALVAAGLGAPRQDLAVRLPDEPGALATFGEILGEAGVSLEGGGGFTVGDHAVVHFLVREGERAASVLRARGLDVIAVRDIVEVRLAQGEVGQLGTLARAMASAGVNLECVYSDHEHRLILVVDDLVAAQRVAAAWRRAPGVPQG